MPDFATTLASFGPTLTKTYKADGTTDAYDDAASFVSKEIAVADLRSLSRLLTKLETRHQHCIIRGKFVGDERAEPGKVEGSIARTNANFDDCPHHWFMVDIDKYEPDFDDPVHDPVNAIKDYIARLLPPSFKDASFHWQLSSSAGMPGKTHILKAHVWFWSETPYTSAQMYAWAKQVGIWIDKAVYRRVQIHFTANPIFEAGRTDPVTVRSGFYQGTRETVDLQIDPDVLDAARVTAGGSGGHDMKLVDPSEKESLVGLFHQLFSAEDVLLTHLEGEFEQVTERRYTWLNGGGTPEGVWVHEDGMHVGATHNTWPIDGIVNLWDLVRIFKFGELDEREDAFEQFDLDSLPVYAKPSQKAMEAWVEALPEVRKAQRSAHLALIDEFKALLDSAEDRVQLEQELAPRLRQELRLTQVDREELAVHYKACMDRFTGGRMAIKDARRAVAREDRLVALASAPGWAHEWVWDAENDGFVHIDTKLFISERSYNAKHDRMMQHLADEQGVVPKASDYALKFWDVKVVDRTQYNPVVGEALFKMDGLEYLNTYRSDLAPTMPGKFGYDGRQAIKILETHTEILIPDERERTLFLDYLAYCVQKPGHKIRWAPLLKGVEGDGKSAFVILMAHVLGHPNVRILDSATLEKSDFSGWGTGQCFTGVEEVKLHGHNKYDIYNKLKPYISNDFIEVHRKGKDPYNVPNTTNYLLLSNFDDAVPVTDNDRRVMFIRSPFNTKEEMFKAVRERTGMDVGDYFARLFDEAIKKHPGALRKWLYERELSAGFAADGRAPITSAREMVVELSVRDDETAVHAAVEEQGLGVYPELVSTWHMTTLVRNRYDIELRTSRVASVLVAAGFRPLGQIKWRGRPCRFYLRGEPPTGSVQAFAEALEKRREDQTLEEAFCD